MPLYEYECKTNKHRFEVRAGVNDEHVKTCPECGAEVRRVIHPVGIVFKGPGFYATDSRSTNAASKPADGKPDSGATAEKSGGDGESTKTEAPAASKTDKPAPSTSEPAAG